MQMTGRAGRTNFQVKDGSRPDSYIIVPPTDSGRFEKLVEQHVEDLKSQLLQVSPYYVRSRTVQGACQQQLTGVTRVILTSLGMDSAATARLSELLNVYRLTLLYKTGKKSGVQCENNVSFTIEPLLKELQVLLNIGHVLVFQSEATQHNLMEIEVISQSVPVCSEPLGPEESEKAATISREDLQALTAEEMKELQDNLCKGLQNPEDKMHISDYFLSMSPIACASTAASLSVSDAEVFINEAKIFETNMPLQNPLAFLYLSITEAMSKQLILDPHYGEDGNTKNASIIRKILVKGFDEHPDAPILNKIGLGAGTLMEWVLGNPVIRRSKSFNDKLTRAWSALFLKEVLVNPDNFNQLCTDFGFKRSMALELSTALSSRLQNLKCLCSKLDQFWWFPPLARNMSTNLGQACSAEIRPLLVLRHVTLQRAKNMYNMGFRTVQDVAQVFPPNTLSDKVPHIPLWMAVDMILNARMLVEEEAARFEAECQTRRKLLD